VHILTENVSRKKNLELHDQEVRSDYKTAG
jgi:hypothetical protein